MGKDGDRWELAPSVVAVSTTGVGEVVEPSAGGAGETVVFMGEGARNAEAATKAGTNRDDG